MMSELWFQISQDLVLIAFWIIIIYNFVTDKDGNPKKVKFEKMTYLNLANTFGKSSPDTEYYTINQAYTKMSELLMETKYLKGNKCCYKILK